MKYILIPIYARNWNPSDDTLNFLKELEYKAKTPEIRKWIKKTLTGWLIENYEGKLHSKFDPTNDKGKEWIEKALKRGDKIYDVNISDKDKEKYVQWVEFLNNNIPKPNFSVADLLLHLDKYNATQRTQNDKNKGFSIIKKYPNGCKWVNLIGLDELYKDGELMNVCFKNDDKGYGTKVRNKKIYIITLRDGNNKPQCAIEYIKGKKRIEQIKGIKNEEIKKEYIPFVLDFLNSKYVPYTNVNNYDLIDNNLVVIDNKVHDVIYLPDNLTVEKDLNLRGTDLEKLPNNLTVNGDLNIEYSHIEELPDNLIVKGDLKANSSDITEIGEDVEVYGDVELNNTMIKKIPFSLKAYKSIYLEDISENFTLPDNLVVKNNLSLSNSNIERLPKDLKVMGTLECDASSLRQLPADLYVGGDLDISYTRITSIPETVVIKGQLKADGCRLDSSKLSV